MATGFSCLKYGLMVVTYFVDLPLTHCKHENEVIRSY